MRQDFLTSGFGVFLLQGKRLLHFIEFHRNQLFQSRNAGLLTEDCPPLNA